MGRGDQLLFGERWLRAHEPWHGDFPGAVRNQHRHDLFIRDLGLGHRQISLVDGEGIRADGSADDAFTQAPAGVYDDFVAIGGHRIGAEDHRGRVGRHQVLDEDGHLYAVEGQPVALAVFGDAFGPGGVPAAQHGVRHGRIAAQIQVGLVLSGKRGEAPVFVNCRRPHGHAGQLGVAALGHFDIGVGELALELGWELVSAPVTLSRPLLEGVSGEAEAGWDLIVGRESAQIGDLAANARDILTTCIVQPDDVHPAAASAWVHSLSTRRHIWPVGFWSRSAGGRRWGRTLSKHWSMPKRKSEAGRPTAVKPG